jgi:hypothetical protein
VRRAKARKQAEEAEAEQERVRKQAQEERKREEQQRAEVAMKHALQARRLVMEGMDHDQMGAYELLEGTVVRGRAVWQQQRTDGMTGWFLYKHGISIWTVGNKEDMEGGHTSFIDGRLYISHTGVSWTPDQLNEWFMYLLDSITWKNTGVRVRLAK